MRSQVRAQAEVGSAYYLLHYDAPTSQTACGCVKLSQGQYTVASQVESSGARRFTIGIELAGQKSRLSGGEYEVEQHADQQRWLETLNGIHKTDSDFEDDVRLRYATRRGLHVEAAWADIERYDLALIEANAVAEPAPELAAAARPEPSMSDVLNAVLSLSSRMARLEAKVDQCSPR